MTTNTEARTPKQIAQQLYDELFDTTAIIVATGKEHAPTLISKVRGGLDVILMSGVGKDVIAQAQRARRMAN